MNNFFINQVREAKYNFNYFFMKAIVKVMQILMKLAIILLLNQIFNYIIVNIITIIITIYCMYDIYTTIIEYKEILDDIKFTLKDEQFFYEIDLNTLFNNLFKTEEKYGK